MQQKKAGGCHDAKELLPKRNHFQTSPSKPRPPTDSDGGGSESISNALLPLVAKTKHDVKLKGLTVHDISQWGDAAEAYENEFDQPWNRHEIVKSLRNKISFGWKLPVYGQYLPESIQSMHLEGDSWMDPAIISTADLVRFLQKNVDVGQGKSHLNENFESLIDFITNYKLPLKRATVARGVEDFLTQLSDKEDDNQWDFIPIQEKDLCCAQHD